MEKIGLPVLNFTYESKKSVQQINMMQRFINLFKKKEAEILHLGGTRLASHDFAGKHKILHTSYFYEKIPIKTSIGEIFIYGDLLKPHVQEWMRQIRHDKTKKTFQNFINEKLVSDPKLENSLIKQGVRYFNEADRNQTKIKVVHGNLVQIGLDSNNKILKPLPPGEHIFVIADTLTNGKVQRNLYATPKSKTKAGKTQHSSFVRAGNVLSAGKISVDDHGVLTIRNFSGHYRPQPTELAAALKYMQEAGCDLSKMHVRCYNSDLSAALDYQFNIKWGSTSQRADLWFKQTGQGLL